MKVIFLLGFLVSTIIMSQAQKIDKLPQNPDEKIIVNKEFDENGNIISYDSTYIHQWSSDTSMVFPFDFNNQFSFRGGFPDMDSFMKGFFNDSSFSAPFFGRNYKFMDQLRKHLSEPDFMDRSPFAWDSIMTEQFPDDFFGPDPFGSFFDDFDKSGKRWEKNRKLFAHPDSIPGNQFFYFGEPKMNDEQLKEYRELKEKQRKEMEEFRKRWEKKNEKTLKKI